MTGCLSRSLFEGKGRAEERGTAVSDAFVVDFRFIAAE